MEKTRAIMRREDGFTLVELLAVIVILGIILAIAIPAIGSIISDSRDKATKAEVQLILDAARLYFTTTDTEKTEVTPAELVTAGFLESKTGEGATDWSTKDTPVVVLLDNGSVSLKDPDPEATTPSETSGG